MRDLVLAALALSLVCQPAAAQPASAPARSALPMFTPIPLLKVVPDVGATPGMVLLVEHPGRMCAANAVQAADGVVTPASAISTCNEAILSGAVPEKDLPGVFVNRGVLLMMLQRKEEAKRDFHRAIELDPNAGEALVNLGIMAIEEGRPAEGVAEIDRAIAIGTERPERAYLNRGRGREDMKDLKGAYADYQMAARLRPDWPPVMEELSRFRVTSP